MPPIILCDEAHQYTVDAVPKPGVTEILSDILGDSFSGVDPETLKHAQQRGEWTHEACVLDDAGKLMPGSLEPGSEVYLGPEIAPRVLAFREFRKVTGWKTESAEKMVCHPAGYCGRLDFLGTMPIRGRGALALLDLKTGEPQRRVRLQLCAYQMAIQDTAPITRACLELRENGTFKLDVFDLPEHRGDMAAWKTVLNAYSIKREYA